MNLNREQIEKLSQNREEDTGPLPDNSYVMNDVKEMKEMIRLYKNGEIDQNLSESEFKSKLEEKFKNLNENFPAIFLKVHAGTLEISRLEFMLKMIREINKKKVTRHEASVVVGQELVDNIVKPNLK